MESSYPEDSGDHYWWRTPTSTWLCHWCGVSILTSTRGEPPSEAARSMWGPNGDICKEGPNIEIAYERFDSGAEELMKAFGVTEDELISRMLNKITEDLVEG